MADDTLSSSFSSSLSLSASESKPSSSKGRASILSLPQALLDTQWKCLHKNQFDVNDEAKLSFVSSDSSLTLTLWRIYIESDHLNLCQLQQLLKAGPVVIILSHGGHFAAAVYEHGQCVAHKTIHRYVTRKKVLSLCSPSAFDLSQWSSL